MQYNNIMGGKSSIMTGRANIIQVTHQDFSSRPCPKTQGTYNKLTGGKSEWEQIEKIWKENISFG